MKFSSLQIDNQYSHNTQYPVVFYSSKELTREQKDVFNFSLDIVRGVPDVFFIKKTKFLIQKLMIWVDDSFVDLLSDFFD